MWTIFGGMSLIKQDPPYVEKCETEEYIWFVSKEPIRNDNKYLIAHVVTLVPREKPTCRYPNFQALKFHAEVDI